VQLAGSGQQLQAGHLRHPLVSDDHRDRHIVSAQPLQHLQRRYGGPFGEDLVVGSKTPAQGGLEHGQDVAVIGNGHQHRLLHAPSYGGQPERDGSLWLPRPSGYGPDDRPRSQRSQARWDTTERSPWPGMPATSPGMQRVA
jgi:hypothetical protein